MPGIWLPGIDLRDADVETDLSTAEGRQSAAAAAIANLLIWLTGVENTHLAGQVIYDDGGADATLRGDDIWSWNDAR